jgi:triphosphatase
VQLEQEIKLVVDGQDEIDLSSLPWLLELADGDIETHHLISTYYDTLEQYLKEQGIGLRLRKKDARWFQTVKTTGEVKNGFHQRQEWENELFDANWNLTMLKQTPLATIIEDTRIWSILQAIFTTDFIRKTLQVTLSDGTQVELAYDYGEVCVGDLRGPIHEIELELKSGSVKCLELLAHRLCEHLSLKRSDCSKAQQGYQLANLFCP